MHDNDHLIPRNSSPHLLPETALAVSFGSKSSGTKISSGKVHSTDMSIYQLTYRIHSYKPSITFDSSCIHGSARSTRYFPRDGLHKGCEPLHPPDQAFPRLSQCASTHRQLPRFRGPVPASQRGQLCRTGWKAKVRLCCWRIRCRLVWYVSSLVMVTGAWLKSRTLTECRRIYERKAGFSQRIQLESQEQKARAAQSRYTTALRIFRNVVSLTSFLL